MSSTSILCFGIFAGIVLSALRRGADPLSPARVFGMVWTLAIGLTDLKFSSYQREWNSLSWVLLLIGVMSFLLGTYAAGTLYLRKTLLPIPTMRSMLAGEGVREGRLFWSICATSLVYAAAYLMNYITKGWLPIEAAEKNISRVDFNVTGLTFLIYLVPSILFFVVLYFLRVRGRQVRKALLIVVSLFVLGSFLLFVSRFQIIVLFVLCFVFFYYATRLIRLRSALITFGAMVGFFYWISSIRLSRFVAEYLYWSSKMKFPVAYAALTEPYMYIVMNLENFARSVNKLDYHTFGYYTFDFITAAVGLKYPLYEYFNLERHPFLISGYNTYSALWSFYCDFGVIGLALIPWVLGFGTSLIYYRMRRSPTSKNVTAYAVMVFVMLMSFFVFPLSWLWFVFDIVVIYIVMRYTAVAAAGAPEGLNPVRYSTGTVL